MTQAALSFFGNRSLAYADVLVNNAGNFYAGYFEELTPVSKAVGGRTGRLLPAPPPRRRRGWWMTRVCRPAGWPGH